MKYDFRKIEKKWQKEWERKKLYSAKDFDKKPKYYSLFEFPYLSGDGLHVGHIRPYVAMDIISRKRRMEGYNVLFPVGWDAFGLPTENYAIKTGIPPQVATKKNADNFRRQMKLLGLSLDWSREINTSDPNYYQWTQWIFLKLFEHGLAYKANIPINWCPSCKIGLANEEAAGGKCDRCGGPVEKRMKEQWMLKITAYADKLLGGLKNLDFLPEIKRQQENWIGRSEGHTIEFRIQNSELSIKTFTTRADTLPGATYLVLAPEHPLMTELEPLIKNKAYVKKYIEQAKRRSDQERVQENSEKTGTELKGVNAINPFTEKEIPVWVADYVLAQYGTGAIMAVPAHDERDFAFARRFKLPIVSVISPPTLFNNGKASLPQAYVGNGKMINAGDLNGVDNVKAKEVIASRVGAKKSVNYKLRDWVFSRQRYWGEPIPLIHCEKCALQDPSGQGWLAVRDMDLPVKLPKIKNYKPSDDGQSPLASVASWVNVKCPKCKGPAKRETDVMPNWAGSSWYYLRYIDPKNYKALADRKKMEYWLGPVRRATPQGDASGVSGGVDWYNGGMEHVTLHLLYSRFWNLFLHDIGVVPVPEPYKKRTAHGLILGEHGVKMSKSKGNVVIPDDLVKEFGADALRLYEMFIGPFEQAVAWDPRGILGTSRFLERVWKIGVSHISNSRELENKEEGGLLHKMIKKVTADIESMSFNTAISAMMIFINECQKHDKISYEPWKKFLLILAPFAPHLAEELWRRLGEKTSIHKSSWPEYDEKFIEEETFELVIQVNGKLRDKVLAARGLSQKGAEKLVFERPKIKELLGSKKPVKVIFIPERLINLVV